MMRSRMRWGRGSTPGAGTSPRVFLRVRDGRVAEARFQAYGCGPTIAAASAVSELRRAATLEALQHLKPEEVEAALDGLPDDRKHAADVVAEACARRRATG